jgi:eukaryotic-like serine/threonine-protein kinase
VTLAAGSRLGPYEILSAIGAGGMGEVYRAKDTRLERTVAIKVLPERFSGSAETRQRFEREAKTISQLSHPHICALYDVGREGETEYLVMEYLEGETLADRLAKRALHLNQALRYGIEIADALAKAHRQGIVHRDLKPGNVMLTKSGVKLLDFGLARMRPSGASELLSAAATEGPPLTVEGTILGTLQYMAPEQLEGKETDARTDIFSFGAVLYEMVSGRKAFSGTSKAGLISSILSADPPPLSKAEPTSPPVLDRVVRTCLAKEPDDRWQNAGDVARELGWIASGPPAAAETTTPAARKKPVWLPWSVAALGILAGLLGILLSRRPQAAQELTRFTIQPPPGRIFFGVSLAPDARRILFLVQDDAGRNSIAVRSLDGLEMTLLAGTDDARGMFWSPDGREIAFFSERKLKRMPASGGPVQTVCDSAGAFWGTWGRNGTILFARNYGDPIFAVPATGGTPRPVTNIDAAKGELAHYNPEFLPDGRHFLFGANFLDPEKSAVVVGSLDGKETRRLFLADTSALFSEPGYLLFGRDGALLAQRFDAKRVAVLGEAAPVFGGVRALREDSSLAASTAGNRIVYLTWLANRRLVWVDRKGRELGELGSVGDYSDVRISPDGRRAAVTIRDPLHGLNQDVWVLDASRGTRTRITFEGSEEFDPAWYPDGERLVYATSRAGFYDVHERPASGGPEKILLRTKQDKIAPTVSPDGRQLLVDVPESGNYLRYLAPLSGGAAWIRLSADSRFSEEHPELSPDGRWMAFDSNESGPREVYVQSLPEGPKRQVSIAGGQMPVWNRNGSELFYAARDGMLMSVSVRIAPGGLEIGEPQPLFLLQLGTSGELPWHRHPYDVALDGRFLVIRRADAEPDAAVVVTNWTEALKAGR